MADEISNVFSHVKLNEDDIEDNIENDMVEGDSNEDIENDMVEVESNEGNIENEIVELNEMVETKGVENKVEDPKLGMMFDSIDDAVIYYRRYAKEKGFAVAKRTSKKGNDGAVRYVTIACSYAGKPRIRLNCPGIKRTRSTNPVQLKPQTKTDCKAQLRIVKYLFGRLVVLILAK
nr:protein far1-related sequence 8 [Quercus suber]